MGIIDLLTKKEGEEIKDNQARFIRPNDQVYLQRGKFLGIIPVVVKRTETSWGFLRESKSEEYFPPEAQYHESTSRMNELESGPKK